MNSSSSVSSRVLILLGYGILALYLVEFIGEISPLIEGVYVSLGIQWRYPIFFALIAFIFAYLIDKRAKKPVVLGIAGIFGLLLFFIIVYLYVLFSMMVGG
ncbi:hypothetical protein [Alkalihalobacillus sp. TS-13]|uniref:hypothetical protein n=1 Tax=Alkalihalobacillus sp. TS-13 TaxID=2842455 RepID=UPI001C88AAA5|nr:hypothetical protein [Alkalihalobacillus sp. TS-13]